MQSDLDASLLQSANDLIRRLLKNLEDHAPGESGHAERVAVLATAIGERLGLDDVALLTLRRSAQLHDIGKIRVAASTLTNPGNLSDDDWKEIRQHPIFAEAVLEPHKELAYLLPLIRHHHERWDGTGYPDGLAGDAIPLGSRIIAGAEAFDSLTHRASFRAGVHENRTLAELSDCAGNQFDPEVVVALANVQPLIQPIGD